MTDISHDQVETGTAPPRRSMMQWGAVAFLLSAVLTAVGTFSEIVAGDSGDEDAGDEVVGWLVMMAVLAVVTVVLYRFWFSAAAEAPTAPNTVLVAGLLAGFTVMAFWSGLPSLFAVAALVLGRKGGGPKAAVGMVLAALALGLCVFAAIFG